MAKTILFMDNNPRFLDVHARLLERVGYQVERAPTIDMAEQQLQCGNIHVAIFDVRMEDDNDHHDISGLLLAQRECYRFVPKIMLTAYTEDHDYTVFRELLGPIVDGLPPAVDILDKEQDGPEGLIQAVEKVFDLYVPINWQLQIYWEQPFSFVGLNDLIHRKTAQTTNQGSVHELEDLIRKVFYQSQQITMGRLLFHGPGQVIFEVSAFGPEGVEAQFVVSCGLRDVIHQENERYETLISRISGQRTVICFKRDESIHLAATAYKFVGADIEMMSSFGLFCQSQPLEQILKALEDLFLTTLEPWHLKGRSSEDGSLLSKLILNQFGTNKDKMIEGGFEAQMETLTQEALAVGLLQIKYAINTLEFGGNGYESISYPNPIPYFLDNQPLTNESALFGIRHGQITSETVWITPQSESWLINYTQIGYGPLIDDFVSLEFSLKQRLSECLDLQRLYEVEQRLLEPSTLTEPVSYEELPPESVKILRVVEHIRRLAETCLACNMQLYLSTLFFYAIGQLTTYESQIHYKRRELKPFVYSLLMSAMLCEKLSGDAESLAHLPLEARTSLWLHYENKIVWVKGRSHKLTPQEFDILSYLYENANKPCRREDIVALLGGQDIETEKGRLNSAINRLRKKIEPDPRHPTYIISTRSEGYTLRLSSSIPER